MIKILTLQPSKSAYNGEFQPPYCSYWFISFQENDRF